MRIGIVGATTDKNKYGYKVLKNLKKRKIGELFPINPKYKEIEGISCFESVEKVPYDLDLVVFIVPGSVGIKILKEIVDRKIRNVWFQPGAESEEIEEFCKNHGLHASFHSCIMISEEEEIKEFIGSKEK